MSLTVNALHNSEDTDGNDDLQLSFPNSGNLGLAPRPDIAEVSRHHGERQDDVQMDPWLLRHERENTLHLHSVGTQFNSYSHDESGTINPLLSSAAFNAAVNEAVSHDGVLAAPFDIPIPTTAMNDLDVALDAQGNEFPVSQESFLSEDPFFSEIWDLQDSDGPFTSKSPKPEIVVSDARDNGRSHTSPGKLSPFSIGHQSDDCDKSERMQQGLGRGTAFQAWLQAQFIDGPPAIPHQAPSEEVSDAVNPYSDTQPTTAPTSLLPPAAFGSSFSSNYPITTNSPGLVAALGDNFYPIDPASASPTISDNLSEFSVLSTQEQPPPTNLPTSTTCPQCYTAFSGLRTNQQRNLRRHMRDQHSMAPRLSCPIPECTSTFRSARPDNLKRHLENQHEENSPSSPPRARKRKADEITRSF